MIVTIEELRHGAKNINTSKSMSCWLSVRKTWCEGKSIALEIKEHEAAELNCQITRVKNMAKIKIQRALES